MLREEFGRGSVLVDNTVESVTAAVRQIQGNVQRYRDEALALREVKERRWEKNRQLLIGKLTEARKRARPHAAY